MLINATKPGSEPRLRLDVLLENAIRETLKREAAGNPSARGYVGPPQTTLSNLSPEHRRPGVLSFKTMNRLFDENDLIRAVVDTKRRQMIETPWAVQKIDEDRFAPMGLMRKLENLFRWPDLSGKEDWTSLGMSWAKDMLVMDAGAIEKVRDSSRELVELVPLDGATIIPIVDGHGRIQRYEQRIRKRDGSETTVEFQPEDLIYLRANPSTQRGPWGQSPIESLAVTIGAEIYSMNYNTRVFTDGNLMNHILVLGQVGKEALKDMKAFFNENRGKHELPIIDGLPDGAAGAKLFTLNKSNRDMEFHKFQEWIFQRICAAFQVSADEVIQLQAHLTKAAGEQQRDIHQDKSRGPELAIIQGRFTVEVVQEFHENLEFRFVEAEKLDEETEAKIWDMQFSSGRPLNELRVDAGLDPLTMPTIDVDGEKVCIFDLPINPATGYPYGVQKPAPEGGDDGGWPFFSLDPDLTTAKEGRRRPRARAAGQRAFSAYEANRSELARRAQARLSRAGGESSGNAGAVLEGSTGAGGGSPGRESGAAGDSGSKGPVGR